MKPSIFVTAFFAILIACSPSKDKQAREALSRYRTFVDSIYTMNESWKIYPDTDFVETPTDPQDPTKTRIDTIVTPPESKTSLLKTDFMSKGILQSYDEIKANVESNTSKMDEEMKKEYQTAKQKFESMQ